VSERERARQWSTGAILLLDELDDALTRVSTAGVGPSTLKRTPLLYQALLGYTFLGGCGHVLKTIGEPAPGQEQVRDQLRRACSRVERASDLFARAVRLDSTALLVRAAAEALATGSALNRARESLTRPP
jgi:hypothetical protein